MISDSATPDPRKADEAASVVDRFRRYEADRDPPALLDFPWSLEAWRTRRLRSSLLPMTEHARSLDWLTVGDGYFGCDASYLRDCGVEAEASCLDEETMRQAAQRGWINHWRIENVEAIKLPDRSRDVILCMEALQHCEKPYLGLYEMLRVARQFVVVFNCLDRSGRLFDAVRELLRSKRPGMRVQAGRELYEVTGTYLYRMGHHELTKAAHALEMAAVARKSVTNFPPGAAWQADATWSSPAYWRFRAGWLLVDVLCRMRLMSPSFGWTVIFREPPDPALRRAMIADGFVFDGG